MIIDCHNHIGYRKGAYYSAEEIIAHMDENNLDRAVVFSQCETIDNDYVASSVERYPERLIGFVLLDPWAYNAAEELSRLTTMKGLKGLKLNPTRHGFALDRRSILDPLFEICAQKKIPIISHGKDDIFSLPGKFEAMARAWPQVTLIMAHMGLDRCLYSAFRAVNRCPNLYVDTAGVHPKAIRQAIKEIGPRKILMGTDAPWGRFELSLQAIEAATEDPEERRLIMGGNLMRVLGIN